MKQFGRIQSIKREFKGHPSVFDGASGNHTKILIESSGDHTRPSFYKRHLQNILCGHVYVLSKQTVRQTGIRQIDRRTTLKNIYQPPTPLRWEAKMDQVIFLKQSLVCMLRCFIFIYYKYIISMKAFVFAMLIMWWFCEQHSKTIVSVAFDCNSFAALQYASLPHKSAKT